MENTINSPSENGKSFVRIKFPESLKSTLDDFIKNQSIIIDNTQPDIECTPSKDQVLVSLPRSKKCEFKTSPENLTLLLDKIIKTQIFELRDTNTLPDVDFKLEKILPSHHFFKVLNRLLKNSENINSFVHGMFSIAPFDEFESIYYFVHRKASADVRGFSVSKNLTTKMAISYDTFVELFNSIKKSKNHSFGQNSLKASEFEILGTCIALEFTLKNDNLILIFSKDDFLPQKKEDIDFINGHKKIIQSYFEIILATDYNFELYHLYQSVVHELTHLEKHDQLSMTPKLSSKIADELKNKYLNIADIHQQERIVLLGELLNTLKHELSNPLFGLQLTTELLKEDPELDDEQAEFIEQIHLNIERSQKIISNFAGLYQTNDAVETVNIHSVIEEILTLTKSESRDIKKTIINKLPENFEFTTNKTLLAQILFNLIINSTQALKAAKKTDPLIEIVLKKTEHHLIISVRDNGPGVTPEMRSTIFEPFHTTKDNGTGLGLTISSRLANKLNGQLKCVETNLGARFDLEIRL